MIFVFKRPHSGCCVENGLERGKRVRETSEKSVVFIQVREKIVACKSKCSGIGSRGKTD